MSLNILIVEDELLIAEMIAEMLEELSYQTVGIAGHYEEAKNYLDDVDEKIDLVLVDINLSSEKDGLDLGLEINEKYQIPIIYITSYSDPEMIKKAATLLPEAYLVKPFTKTDLLSSIELVKMRLSNRPTPLCIKVGSKFVNVFAKDIQHIKSDKNYLEIFVDENRYVIRNSLDKFLEEVNCTDIVRTHRSFAVNLRYVREVFNEMILLNDVEIPLSRKYKSAFKEFLLAR